MDGWVDGRKEPRWTSHLKATLNSRAVFGPANFNMLMFIKDYVCTDFWTKDFIPSVPHDNNNYQGLSLKTKAETLLLKTFWRRLRFWMIKNGSDSRWLLLRCRAEQGLKTHPINIFLEGLFTLYFRVSSEQPGPEMLTERTHAISQSSRELTEQRRKLFSITSKLWGKKAVAVHGLVFWVSVCCGLVLTPETACVTQGFNTILIVF